MGDRAKDESGPESRLRRLGGLGSLVGSKCNWKSKRVLNRGVTRADFYFTIPMAAMWRRIGGGQEWTWEE